MLPNGVDEIGIRRSVAGGPHVSRNLSTMVGRMHHNMHEDIRDTGSKYFSFGVRVGHAGRQPIPSEIVQIAFPDAPQGKNMVFAISNRELRPNRERRGFLPQTGIPDVLCCQDVRQQTKGPRWSILRSFQEVQYFLVCPVIVSEQPAEIIDVHVN